MRILIVVEEQWHKSGKAEKWHDLPFYDSPSFFTNIYIFVKKEGFLISMENYNIYK